MARSPHRSLGPSGKRAVALSTSVGVGIVGVLLVLPFSAGATSPLVALTAPYTGSFTVHTIAGVSAAPCGTAVIPLVPRFNQTSVIATGAAEADLSGCPTVGGFGNFSSVEEGVGLVTAPVTVTTSGPLSLRENWVVRFAAAIVVTNVSSTNYAWGDYFLEVFGAVDDLTSHVVYGGNTTILADGFTGYSNGSQFVQSVNHTVVTTNVSAVGGHSYRFEAFFIALLDAYVSGPGPAHVKTWVNWGTGRNSAQLLSFTVT